MSDYKSIADIIAGVGNATQTRTNSKNDDGTDTITGVDWFSYGGTVCRNIYASGNSWIGLGASSEHLKVNRRDAAMWNLWREEGVYLSYYKFLRIRWSGYTAYSSTSTNNLLTYDVILFDTGDIMLYMVDVPTSSYSGTFTLGSLSYTAPTTDSRYVTFYLQEDGSYVVDYAPISLVNPYITRYLVRDSGIIYTVSDGVFTEVTGELNAQLFIDSGVEEIPDGTLLLGLAAPEVLCWTDSDIVPTLTVPILKATLQGTPTEPHDIISENIRLDHESIHGIASVEATAIEGATFLLSFDGGAYMVYDTDSNSWAASDVGMTATDLVAIPAEAWTIVTNSHAYMNLKVTIDGTGTVTQVKFNFDNDAQ